MTDSITPPRTYLVVFAGLIGLTAATVGLSYIDLGEGHTLVGLAIAVTKAMLIVLFFMHLLHGPRLSWVIAGSGLFWLGILLSLSLTDFLTRPW
jgi:cytochrome c oxidase subunit 4